MSNQSRSKSKRRNFLEGFVSVVDLMPSTTVYTAVLRTRQQRQHATASRINYCMNRAFGVFKDGQTTGPKVKLSANRLEEIEERETGWR